MLLDKMVADKMVWTKWYGQNGIWTKWYWTKWYGQNGKDKMVWTKWYMDKMVLDKMVRTKWYMDKMILEKMVRTKWYNFIFCVQFHSLEFNIYFVTKSHK